MDSVLTDGSRDRTAREQRGTRQALPGLLQQEDPVADLLTWIWEAVRRLVQACGVAPADIEDVVQEVVLEGLRRSPERTGKNPSRQLRAWLTCVVQGKAVDAHRRAGRHRADDLSLVVAAGREPIDPQPGPALALEQRETRERFRAAFEMLRPRLGESNARILELRFLEGQSVAQVAATLGLTAKAVRVRQCRTLRKLRRMPLLVKLNDLWGRNWGGVIVSRPAATVDLRKIRKCA